MKNSEIINLSRSIGMVGNLRGIKFAYGVAKNAKKIASEVECINKAEPAEYKAYMEERQALIKEHTKKNENGTPMIAGNNYVMKDDNKFNSAAEALKEKCKDAIEAYDKWMEEENELNFHMINIDDVPADITVQQMVTIEPMITEEKKIEPAKKEG